MELLDDMKADLSTRLNEESPLFCLSRDKQYSNRLFSLSSGFVSMDKSSNCETFLPKNQKYPGPTLPETSLKIESNYFRSRSAVSSMSAAIMPSKTLTKKYQFSICLL